MQKRTQEHTQQGMLRRRYLVSGRVQGVGFRNFVMTKAHELGLFGCVRNLDDGRVEAYAEGESSSILKLELELAKGPRASQVTQIEKADCSESPIGKVHGFNLEDDGDSPWALPS